MEQGPTGLWAVVEKRSALHSAACWAAGIDTDEQQVHLLPGVAQLHCQQQPELKGPWMQLEQPAMWTSVPRGSFNVMGDNKCCCSATYRTS